jgi:hypothetical protein
MSPEEKMNQEEFEVVFDGMINYIELLMDKKIPFNKALFDHVLMKLNNLRGEDVIIGFIGFPEAVPESER